MARNDKLKRASEKYKAPLQVLIPRLVEEHGGVEFAAALLGVYPNTVRNWLNRNGYEIRRRTVVEVVKVSEKAS